MSFFYLNGGGRQAIRLAFSSQSADEIEEGVSRLAAVLRDHQ